VLTKFVVGMGIPDVAAQAGTADRQAVAEITQPLARMADEAPQGKLVTEGEGTIDGEVEPQTVFTRIAVAIIVHPNIAPPAWGARNLHHQVTGAQLLSRADDGRGLDTGQITQHQCGAFQRGGFDHRPGLDIGEEMPGGHGKRCIAGGGNLTITAFQHGQSEHSVGKLLLWQIGAGKGIAAGTIVFRKTLGQSLEAGHVEGLSGHLAERGRQLFGGEYRVAIEANALKCHGDAAGQQRQGCRGLDAQGGGRLRQLWRRPLLLQQLAGVGRGLGEGRRDRKQGRQGGQYYGK
jgi:hypothetical protein